MRAAAAETLALDRYEAMLSRINRAHDVAHSRACSFRSLDAGEISHIASSFAGTWMHRRSARLDQLETVLRILEWLTLAAAHLERLETVDA
jgi:hypothetical protein